MTLVGSNHARCSELLASENALLWCMRAWVIGHCTNRHTSDRIEAVLAKVGALGAGAEFDGFMRALSQGARGTMEINCVCYPDVSDDKRRLLDAFALQQQGNHDEVYATMSNLLTVRAAAVACERLKRLALALDTAGRVSRRPSPNPANRIADFVCAGMSRYLH